MELQQPKISIIIPSLNQGRYIKQTMDSILQQDYSNIEVLVVDGGSTDETLNILKSYSTKIRWISKKDHGQSEAINKGLRLTSGEICGYLNSDDLLLPGSIEIIAQKFIDKNVMWVTGDYQIVNTDGNQIQSAIVIYKRFLRLFSSRTMLSLVNYIIQPSTFWRRELIEKIGNFDESLFYVMDYDFWMRAFQVQPPLVIKKELSAFRIHSQSKGGKQFIKQFNEEMQVQRRYTKNGIILYLHWLHNQIIINIYKMIK